MQHEISEFVRKVSAMYAKAMMLQRLAYDTPSQDRDDAAIRNLIDDIQSLAGDIYNDREKDKSN